MRKRFLSIAIVLAVACSGCSDPVKTRDNHLKKADEYMEKGEYRSAVLEYRNAIKADAKFGEARYKLALAYERDDRPREAAREYLRAAELMPDRLDVQLKAGNILLAMRDFERARTTGETALAADPKSLEAQLLIAHALAGLKNNDAAVKEIEEAIQLAPADSRPYTTLGTIRMTEGNRDKAREAYEKAVQLDPRSVSARVALGLFYWTDEKLPAAEAQLKEAAALDPKSPLVNRTLALFYLTTNRPDEAEAPLLQLAATDDPNAILTVADHYARTNRVAEARTMYERLKGNRRSRSLGVLRLASLDYNSGQRDQAHAALDEELKSEDVSADVAVLKSRLLLQEGKPQDAESVAKKAIEIDSNSAPAHYALGLAQLARSQTEAATKSFNETLRINPKAWAAQLQLSRLSLAAGNTDEALRLAESARQAQPANLSARLSVARALLRGRELARAEAEILALRKEYPQSATVHALYGGVLAAKSDSAGAVREFDRALQIDPANTQALAGRLSVDLRQKRPQDGRARLARAIAAQPTNAEVLILAGRFEMSAGDLPAAERQLRRVLEVNPAAFDAYALLGQLYVRQQRLDEARQEFEKLASMGVEQVGPKTMVGMIYDIQNKPMEARRAYEEVVKATTRAPVAANNLAWNYAEAGENLDVALQLAQSAKQQLPDSHEVDDTLGWVYVKRNNPELAIPPLVRATQAVPSNAEYQYHLGIAYQRAQRSSDARAALKRALELRPDFPGAAEARAALASLQ